MRECKTCKVVQPLTNYHRDKGTKGGHKYSCKKCTHNKYYKYKKEKKAFDSHFLANAERKCNLQLLNCI